MTSRFLLLFLLLLPVCGNAVTLKIATLVPDGTVWMKAMREAADAIDRQTAGRVKLRFYPGGVMGNDNSVLRKIRVGQLHGGALNGGGLATVYPDALIYNIPFAFRSYEEVDYVRRQMDPLLIQGLREKGFVSFGLSETGFAYLMSDKPLVRAEDLKGQKVWAPEGDPIARAAIEAVGVSPIPLPVTDVLTGLQTGLINTVEISPVGAIALQWHTRVSHITDAPILYLYGALILYEKALGRISEADRLVLRQELEKAQAQIDQRTRQDNNAALQALVQQGIALVVPDMEDLQHWREVVTRGAEQAGGNGGSKLSPAMLDELHRHLADFRKRQ